MAAQAGVWIDHRQAIMVLITETGQEIKKIASGMDGPVGTNHAYASTDYVAEDRLERKAEDHLKNFYDEVIAGFQGAKALLILGPGEAKDELAKRIKSRKLQGVTLELETADKMTEPQLAAKVTAHFGKARK